MNRGVLCLLVIVAVFVVSATANPPKKIKKCDKNEVWSNCDKGCEGTCEDPNPKCGKMCLQGCVCDKGLLRNKEGKCVRPCDCKCCD